MVLLSIYMHSIDARGGKRSAFERTTRGVFYMNKQSDRTAAAFHTGILTAAAGKGQALTAA